MGIHVHVKGKPDMCRCCAIVDRLNELWDRTHNSVLSVNGIYADGNGNVLIQGIQDITDLRQQVADDRQYLEAVAEDLVTNYATTNTEQTITATKTMQIGATVPIKMITVGDSSYKPFIYGYDKTHIDPESWLETVSYSDVNHKGITLGLRNWINGAPMQGAMGLYSNNTNVRAFCPTPYKGAPNDSIPNLEWIKQSDADADNGLVHRNGNETINGTKIFTDKIILTSGSSQTHIYNEKPSGYTSFVLNSANSHNPANGVIMILDSNDSDGKIRLRVLKKLGDNYTSYSIPLNTSGGWY